MEATVERQVSCDQSAKVGLSSLEEMLMMALLNNQAYGWQIVQMIETASCGTLHVGAGSLYPTLRRLEETKGLVESHWGDDSPKGQRGARKRYYSLTEMGISALKKNQDLRDNLIALAAYIEDSKA